MSIFAQKELNELNVELSDINTQLNKIKAFCKIEGNVLSDSDKTKASIKLNKKNRLEVKIKNKEANIIDLNNKVEELETITLNLEVKAEEIAYTVENSESDSITSEALNRYSQARNLISNNHSQESLKVQAKKLQRNVCVSEARAESVESNNDSFEYKKQHSDLDLFLNS